MMPGREMVAGRAETSSHTTRTWEGSEPRKEQPTDAQMPISHYLGPAPCLACACACACPLPCLCLCLAYRMQANIHAFLTLFPSRPRASQQGVCRDSPLTL